MEDMLQISNFLEELNRGKEKAQLSEAKESCLDIKVFGISSMKKIEERKNSLINNQGKLSSKTFDTAIMTMNNCTKILSTKLAKINSRIRNGVENNEIVSPSDIGIHNMIKRNNGYL